MVSDGQYYDCNSVPGSNEDFVISTDKICPTKRGIKRGKNVLEHHQTVENPRLKGHPCRVGGQLFGLRLPIFNFTLTLTVILKQNQIFKISHVRKFD